MNIDIKYIKNKNNVIADGFSRIIFKDLECAAKETIRKMVAEVIKPKNDKKWFWKTGKGGYKNMLLQFNEEKNPIKNYGNVFCPIGWTFFFLGWGEKK